MVVEMVPFRGSTVRVVEDGWLLGSIESDNGLWLTRVESVNTYNPPVWCRTNDDARERVVTEGRRVRDRWQRAIARALAAGLDPLELVGQPHTWAVESASRPGVAYLVTGPKAQTCTCPAGVAGNLICQHRASVLAALGILPVTDPEPEPPAPAPAAPAPCLVCDGDFVKGNSICRACRGSGLASMMDQAFRAEMERRRAA